MKNLGARWTTPATLAIGTLATGMVLFAGLGHRFGLLHFRTALNVFNWGALAALFTLGLACAALVAVLYERASARSWGMLLSGIALALAAYIPHTMFKARARAVPRIHDITTDTQNPPQFVRIGELRGPGTNSTAYGGSEISEQQKSAYPDIQPKVLGMSLPEAFTHAVNVARDLGWEIVETDAHDARIEAVDTTPFFGFKDDVVIRLTPEGERTTRVDLRSASRVGVSDVGANADRIRRYLSRL